MSAAGALRPLGSSKVYRQSVEYPRDTLDRSEVPARPSLRTRRAPAKVTIVMNAMTGIRAQTSENPSHSIAKASGVSAFFISTQGLYIGRIYNQIKEKPLAIIQNSIDRSSKKSYSEADAALQIEVIWLGKEKVGDSGLG